MEVYVEMRDRSTFNNRFMDANDHPIVAKRLIEWMREVMERA
jgi:hypothetical protein